MKIYLFICTRHREFGIFNFLRYLRLPKALQGTLFWKKMNLYEIFQVGACPNLKDSSLYDRFSIHMYKAWSVRFLWLFCAICDSLMPWTVYFFGKRWFFMKYFKLVHAPTWKIPHYMRGFLFICTRHDYALCGTFVSKKRYFKNFVVALLFYVHSKHLRSCRDGQLTWPRFSWAGLFQVGACQNLKDSLSYDRFSIHMYKA